MLRRRLAWGDARVVYLDSAGAMQWIPLSWTSFAPVDAFVQTAAGRCAFRLTDLLALSALLRDLKGGKR